MKLKTIRNLGVLALVTVTAWSGNAQNPKQKDTMNNVLLAEWQGPFSGVPAFDEMQVDLVKPAIEKGMQMHLAEIDKIASNPEPATFENTIIPFEKAGDALDRAFTYYGIYSSNMSSPEFREVQKELSPEIAEYQAKITQNEALFQRIKTVYDNAQKNPLEPEQQRVIKLIYEDFAMQGANLSKEDKQRYAEIDQELSKLYTQFSNNVLADEENYAVYLQEDQLGGLPESYVKSAATAAEQRGHEGEYAVTNTRSSM
ncbi:MAG: M3 family peptidase, partial [Salegentibacter sp.]